MHGYCYDLRRTPSRVQRLLDTTKTTSTAFGPSKLHETTWPGSRDDYHNIFPFVKRTENTRDSSFGMTKTIKMFNSVQQD